MHQNEFATLVAYDGERPIAGHFLMEVVSNDDEAIYINGHMSKGNPLWKSFEKNPEVLVIFQGTHTYISPTWYNHVNVPTWNYISVHTYGNPRIISDYAEYQAMLQRWSRNKRRAVIHIPSTDWRHCPRIMSWTK